MSSMSVESGDVWTNSMRSCRDSCAEVINHVESSSSSDRVTAAAQRTADRCRRGDVVDRPRRLTSFSVADILGPRLGTYQPHQQEHQQHHHHHHQQQQQQSDDVTDDVSESTSNDDELSSSVLSHTSSITDGPSPTGLDRDRCWPETDPAQRSICSRKFCRTLYVISDCLVDVKNDAFSYSVKDL